jgi:hypothetical protein
LFRKSCTTGAGSASPDVYHHAGERGNFAAITLHEKPSERILQVTAHGAADAPARQHDGLAGDGLDQEMVERDLAEFVDDYRGVRHPRPLQ